jgi:hypothetical protein
MKVTRIGRVGYINVYLDEYTADFDKQLTERMRACARAAFQHIRSKTSKPGPGNSRAGEYPRKQSGGLNRGYKITFIKNGHGFKMYTKTPQGIFMEKGVKGGKIIRPKRGRFLRFVGRDGRIRYAKFVRQGRIEARAPLRRTLIESTANFIRILGAPY